MQGVKRQQDGWLVTVRDTDCFWHSSLGAALDRGLEEVATHDECEGHPIELGECAGSFSIARAYRVDFRPAAVLAAEHAMNALADGTLETTFVEDGHLFVRLERELARAFAADIDRVCGPWYEQLGLESVEVLVDRVGDDDDDAEYVIAGAQCGPAPCLVLLAEVHAGLGALSATEGECG